MSDPAEMADLANGLAEELVRVREQLARSRREVGGLRRALDEVTASRDRHATESRVHRQELDLLRHRAAREVTRG